MRQKHTVIVWSTYPSLPVAFIWFLFFALACVRQVKNTSLKPNPTSGNVHGTISHLQYTQRSLFNVFPRCGDIVAKDWTQPHSRARHKATQEPLSETNSRYRVLLMRRLVLIQLGTSLFIVQWVSYALQMTETQERVGGVWKRTF